jgi:hypothetical protein
MHIPPRIDLVKNSLKTAYFEAISHSGVRMLADSAAKSDPAETYGICSF